MLKLILIALFTFGLNHAAMSAENWKGTTQVPPIEAGLLTGYSFFGSSANWSVLGTGAWLLKDKAFVDDLDDRIWIELEMGPTFFSANNSSQTGLQTNAHLRWDFTLNEQWTFYGLGGFGTYVLPKAYNNTFTLHPRFGVGAEYQTKSVLLFRGEISGDFMGLGVALNF